MYEKNDKKFKKLYVESLMHALFYKRMLDFVVIPFGVSEDGERVYFVKWGVYYERKQSEEEVKQLFTKFSGANVAVVLGRPSKVVVIDVDKKEVPSYLEKVNTWIVVTKRGYQFYFRYPYDVGSEGVRSMRLEEGVEFKGDGSLGTLPRSYYHKDLKFRYEWLIPPMKSVKKGILHDLADFSVVRDKLAVYYVRKNEPEALRELYKGVPEGRRNVSITRLAGSLFYDGLEFEEVLSILLAVNRNNDPPLPEKEVVSIVKSIYERDVRKRKVYEEVKEKLCKAIANNGVREGLLKHVEKIKEEVREKGLSEKEVSMLLKRINFYDVYKEVSKSKFKKV